MKYQQYLGMLNVEYSLQNVLKEVSLLLVNYFLMNAIHMSRGHTSTQYRAMVNKSSKLEGGLQLVMPLQQAARDGTFESVKLLLEYGADIDRINKSNATCCFSIVSGLL